MIVRGRGRFGGPGVPARNISGGGSVVIRRQEAGGLLKGSRGVDMFTREEAVL